ncbi:C1q-like domain-containing protein [Chelatococcus asaccharovorans]|uniref:C1q domain-containing protein n=1 Tax=Chelatococcus asaccharovorans TaxID=28210 RepID=A0A2V3UBL8_9HYPH|nr:hypothetical protein [Chelatococcus asaccharovorans]MBS7703169.1 hypothetical protein [Chelatococcus asaccharovorans]PXW61498.1 C1q domain-containing protein [Chelatococcus asaccharovorans]
MSIAVQRRRGTAAEHASFVGFPGELTIVTDDWSLRIHDGLTPGGHSYGASSGLQPFQNLADLTDADTALLNLGGSAIGRNLFKAGNDEAARDLLGLKTMALEQASDFYTKTSIDNLDGKKLRVDAEQSFSSEEKERGLANLGASALGAAVLQADDADAVLDELGATTTGKALVAAEDPGSARALLELGSMAVEASASYMPKAGGTFTGPVTFPGSAGIDASGRILAPAQPAFAALNQANTGVGNGTINGFPFATVHLNVGNHYNPANSRFTAPIAGIYQFTASIGISGNSATVNAGSLSIGIRKNGTNIITVASSGTYFIHKIESIITYLNQNDYVDVSFTMDALAGTVFCRNGSFTGHLIG